MFINFFKKLFVNRNIFILKKLNKIVKKINLLEKKHSILSDFELKNKTKEFQDRLKNVDTLDSILPEAFSVVREASKRVFGIRHFDVQLLGGIILHNSCVAEMRTGEGKTLTATLPAYLHSLMGKGVHIVTMNDYLARRDSKKNSDLFNFLGITVGLNLNGMSLKEKKEAYYSDITYGTNHEFGFDYLRDNMVFLNEEKVQRSLNYALVDEVDSILIDEARTPLIISGSIDNDNNLYKKINKLIFSFKFQKEKEDNTFSKNTGDYYIDNKKKQVFLTELGLKKTEFLLKKEGFFLNDESLYSSKNIFLLHHILIALKAHFIFLKNTDYIVKNNTVIIVDEHTGRLMPERRWSDGIHQAIEAKENISIQKETQTLASITFQNYFRLYNKLSGMTGTASTESYEFSSIYKLNTISVPTNKPMIRKDMPDLVYMTEKEKIDAIILDIKKYVFRNQPVLVGTVSIEKSEIISKKLNKLKIKHNVLNAKFPFKEASIISQAGKPKSVTIATNMAGRGTDIVLGGNLNLEFFKKNKNKNYNINDFKKKWSKDNNIVMNAGGLHVIGTERHESRRIDNQLRGRGGRQGDPGSSQFYLSLEDPLMQIFTSKKTLKLMRFLGVKKGQAITHSWINKAIESAQKKIENQNFDFRKQLLEYDDIINEQRQLIYFERNKLINITNIHSQIIILINDVLKNILKRYFIKNSIDLKKIYFLERDLKDSFSFNFNLKKYFKKNISFSSNLNLLNKYLLDKIVSIYESTFFTIKKEYVWIIEKSIVIQIMDSFWRDHLDSIDFLKQVIYLRGYAQKDPKQEYKREAFMMFKVMLNNIKSSIVSKLMDILFVDFKKLKFSYIYYIKKKNFNFLNHILMNATVQK